MQYFPLDFRSCSFSLASPVYNTQQLTLEPASQNAAYIFLDAIATGNPIWCVAGSSLRPPSDDNLSYPSLQGTILLKRKSTFYVVNVILPGAMLSLWLLVQFRLPPASGERVTSGCLSCVAILLLMVLTSFAVPAGTGVTSLIGNAIIWVMKYWNQALLFKLGYSGWKTGQYHGCWCPESLCR